MTSFHRHILLDIEGTIAPISFVYDVLFPFARNALPDYLGKNWDAPEVRAVRTQIAADAGTTELPRATLVDHLLGLMERDAKSTGLKQLQGLIWREGYYAGKLRSQLFPDVAPTLRAWHTAGVDVRIYSSGSVEAQKLFLSYTEHGDLTPCVRGYYDTTTGPKQSPESYAAIAADWQVTPAKVVFVSDVPAELNAAMSAGMQVRLALRPGNRPVDECSHPRIAMLNQLSVCREFDGGP